MNPKEAQLRAKFLALARDCLRRMGELVARLSDVDEQDETVRQLGRELHTFKGEAHLLDFSALATLAHVTEDVLRHFRSDSRTSSRATLSGL